MADRPLPYVEYNAAGPVEPAPEVRGDLDVSFYVPCYNEEDNVLPTLDKLSAVCGELNLSYEALVFDDGSTDATAERVRQYQREHGNEPIRLFINRQNQGIARNFIEAAFAGRGRHYRLICGDNIEPKETMQAILERMGEAEIVVPYYTRIEGRTPMRNAISRLYTMLVNLASGSRLQYYNGNPLFRRGDVLRFHVEATGLGYQAEFLLRLLQEGRSFVQIPLVASDREGSVALSFRNFVSVGYSLFKILMRRVRKTLFK